jgi:hypothetical protein
MASSEAQAPRRNPGANLCQRRRRATNPRIDYYPNDGALASFRARQAEERPGSVRGTNSAVLDAIVEEWAELTGIKNRQETAFPTSGAAPEFSDANARARITSEGVLSGPKGSAAIENKAKQSARVPCGARRRRDGLPCQALSAPGRRRCKWHGGLSTGPRSPEGRSRALANLQRGRASQNLAASGA